MKGIKGVVLAGGLGTRLRPLTLAVNKHSLPVYNKPLIYYPVLTLKNAGIKDILVIGNPGNINLTINALSSGEDLGVSLTYAIQKSPTGGLADGLAVAENFIGDNRTAFILGDNIFEDQKGVKKAAEDFMKQEKGAKIAIVEDNEPERFGVVRFGDDKKTIVEIVEKPKKAWTNWIVPGLYFYDDRVFKFIKKLEPSERGQLEITDLNNIYIKEGTMTSQKMKGKWIDAGTFDSLLEANVFMAEQAKKNKQF